MAYLTTRLLALRFPPNLFHFLLILCRYFTIYPQHAHTSSTEARRSSSISAFVQWRLAFLAADGGLPPAVLIAALLEEPLRS